MAHADDHHGDDADTPDPLNATPADPAADSYLLLAEANTLALKIGLSRWASKADGQKCGALRLAAIQIDSHIFHHAARWHPRVLDAAPMVADAVDSPDLAMPPVYTPQARAFPRRIDVPITFNMAGVPDASTIPDEVRMAQLFQADWILTSGETDRQLWEKRNIKKNSLGSTGMDSPLCPQAFAFLVRFIARCGEYPRLDNLNGVPIVGGVPMPFYP